MVASSATHQSEAVLVQIAQSKRHTKHVQASHAVGDFQTNLVGSASSADRGGDNLCCLLRDLGAAFGWIGGCG